MLVFTTRIWVAIAATIVFFCAVILGLSVRANNLVAQAESLTSHQQDLNDAIDSITELSDSFDTSEIELTLIRMQTDLVELTNEADWWLRLGYELRWFPYVGADLAAPQVLSQAVESDIKAAQELLLASDRLIQVYISNSDPNKNPTVPSITGRIELLNAGEAAEAHFQQAIILLLEAEEWHNELRTNPPSTTLNSYATSLAEIHDEMFALAVWGDSAMDILPKLMPLVEQIEGIQGQLSIDMNALQPSQLLTLLREIKTLREQAQKPYLETKQLLATTPERITLSPVWEGVEAYVEVIDTLIRMSEAIGDIADVFVPILETAENENLSVLGENSIIQSVGTLLEHQQKLGSADQALKQALNDLVALTGDDQTLPYLGTIDGLVSKLGKVSEILSLTVDFVPLIEEFMGHELPRQYLVLAHNNDEVRPTGGYVFGLWLLSTHKNQLLSTTYFDTVSVDDWSNLASYPTPPESLRMHMNAPVWLLRDVSWEPDFPITAQISQEMFKLGQEIDVDGVLGINKKTIEDILNVLGPVQLQGEPQNINAENFSSTIEKGKDENGREYLDVVLQGILQTFSQSHDFQTLFNLAKAFQNMLATKDLMIVSNNQEVNQLLERQGWSGKLYKGDGDYVLVADSNVGWNKVDHNIVRETEYIIDLSTPETPSSTLTLNYINKSTTELEVALGDGLGNTVSTSIVDVPKCDIQWQTSVPLTWRESLLYDYLKEGCYWNFMRVYVPHSSKLLNGTSLPLPVNSIASTIGLMEAGSDTLETRMGSDLTMFSGLFTIDAGQSRQLHLNYMPSSEVLERSGESLVYKLTLQKQPGVLERNTTVLVHIPDGYRLISSTQQPTNVESKSLTFKFDMSQDIELLITLAPN